MRPPRFAHGVPSPVESRRTPPGGPDGRKLAPFWDRLADHVTTDSANETTGDGGDGEQEPDRQTDSDVDLPKLPKF